MRVDGSPEAVVYVDHGDAARAGVQHRQQGGDAAEGRAVADGSGNGDDGARDQAGDDARQRPFHARTDDEGVGALNQVQAPQEPVQARHADIVQPFHPAPVPFQGQGRFLADRRVRRPRRQHGDVAVGVGRLGRLADRDQPGQGVEDGLRQHVFDGGKLGRGGARRQHAV